VVGRDEGCEIVLDHPGVSRRHARLDPGDGGWHVTDLGSANGTWVNGERLDEAFLLGGEKIRFGTVDGAFALSEDERTASVKLRQTLTVRPARRARPVAAVCAVTAGVLALLFATAWHRGCFAGPRPAARSGRAVPPVRPDQTVQTVQPVRPVQPVQPASWARTSS
jgi:hypothetical protein